MAQSLSKVYTHIIFSTKKRRNLIDESIEPALFNYLGGVCKAFESFPVQVGGYRNHVHILCVQSKKITQIKLLEEVKKTIFEMDQNARQQILRFLLARWLWNFFSESC